MLITEKDFLFKTEPFPHQLTAFELSREAEVFALLMEQGTGKTKVDIDGTGYLFAQGLIDAAVIITLNGVHRNWVNQEIPKHLPDYITRICRFWDSGKVGTKKYARHMEELFHGEGLKVLSINIDAIQTAAGKAFLTRFMESFRCKLTVDESQIIKTWGIARVKAVIKFGKLARYRRILTGTPITQSPVDAFSQYYFLDPEILGHRGVGTFRARYMQLVEDPLAYLPPGTDSRVAFAGLTQEQIKAIYLLRSLRKKNPYAYVEATDEKGNLIYQNLDELKELTAPHSYRITKDAADLKIPPKLYQVIEVDLSPKQKQIYKQVRDELMAELDGCKVVQGKAEAGEVTVFNVLAKMTRLRQIIGGFVGNDAGDVVQIDPPIPRMKSLKDQLDGAIGKAVIWCQYTAEIEYIRDYLGKEFGPEKIVTYYGEMSDDEKEAAKEAFENPENPVRYFIGNPKAGGTGINLLQGRTVLYYSNSFSLNTRLQSEDRCHRIGQENNVLYIDFVAINTLDAKILGALKAKKRVADIITGDKPSNWL